jgi:hypothetical protein
LTKAKKYAIINIENEREVNTMNTIAEKMELYKKALEIVQTVGQELLKDGDYIPSVTYDVIQDIDINIHYLLTCEE